MQLPDDIQAWIRDNAADVVTVLQYLKASPSDFSTLLTVACLSLDRERTFYVGGDAEKRRVEEWLTSAFFGPCAMCFRPCIQFQSGQQMEWPEIEWHDCTGLIEIPEEETTEPTPIRRPWQPSSRVAPL